MSMASPPYTKVIIWSRLTTFKPSRQSITIPNERVRDYKPYGQAGVEMQSAPFSTWFLR